MFSEASALVAILRWAAEADALADGLDFCRLTSHSSFT